MPISRCSGCYATNRASRSKTRRTAGWSDGRKRRKSKGRGPSTSSVPAWKRRSLRSAAAFSTQPANAALRDALRAERLTRQDYYRQLLRVVYRLLFLFVAEDRDVLLDPGRSRSGSTPLH